ncbi:hypothetical protein RHPLAN_53510 [Rhodoplanes sp. Z2-YC6860]|nr:hypothetical protein RHPLAN_53510 [Rhodoplanes sp. Z2-YC6860]
MAVVNSSSSFSRVCAALLISIVSLCLSSVVASAADPDITRCRTLDNLDAQLKCYEDAANKNTQMVRPSPGGSPDSQTIGEWRFIRTPNPQGGSEAVSITRPGDLAKSDPNFVGIMIRCAASDIEVLAVLLQPLPPRARPIVVVNGVKFDGQIVPPGMVRLPPELSTSARTQWPKLPSVSLQVEEGGTSTKGMVFLDGLDQALEKLTTTCPAR